MLPELRDGVLAELAELDALLAASQGQLADPQPSQERLQSLAAILHSFYTVYEGIFKKLLADRGARIEENGQWHSTVLAAIRNLPESSLGLLDQEQYRAMRDILRFRHVFRQGYLLKLNWEKMRPLVQSMVPLHAALSEKVKAIL